MQAKKFFNKAGQATLEMVLIMVVLTGVSIFVKDNYFKPTQEPNFLKTFINGPSEAVACMIRNGNWGNAGQQNSQGFTCQEDAHPNFAKNMWSAEGETVP